MEEDKKTIPFDELVSQQVTDTSFLNRKMRQRIIKYISIFCTAGGFFLTFLMLWFIQLDYVKSTNTNFSLDSSIVETFSPDHTVIYKNKFSDTTIYINYNQKSKLDSRSNLLTQITFFDNNKTIVIYTKLARNKLESIPSFKNFLIYPNPEEYAIFFNDILALEKNSN